jgi:opacity protein-like surface antigen
VRFRFALTIAGSALFSAALAVASFAQGGDPSTPVPGQVAASTPATPAHAGVSGLDVMTSTVFQEGQSSFSGLALRLRLRSGALLPNVEIMPAVEYWQNVSRLTVYELKTTRRDATLGCQVRWIMEREHWRPYLGGGLAVHFLSDKVSSPQISEANQSNSTVRGGYSLTGGVSFPITQKLSNFVELQHHGVSRFRQLKFNTGLGWNF